MSFPSTPAARPFLPLLIVLCSLVAAAAPAAAQPGSLAGRVVDPAGAAIPQAEVTVYAAASATGRTVIADGRGEWRVDALAPGEYTLAAVAPGFAPATAVAVVAAGRSAWVELGLRVERLTETVHVTPERIAGPATRRLIPGSVDVIDRRTLETSNAFTINEALRKVPGVFARDEEGLGLRPNIGIRGTNPTRSTRVLLLEDGVPLAYAPYGDNASYFHPPVERFESIEVLKGSGQIAYGPMTVGGVINYITPAPPARRSGTIQLGGGNREYVNGQASFGTTAGAVGYLVDVMRKQGAGARDHVSSQIDDVNAKSVISIGPAQSLTLRGSYVSEDSHVTYSGLRQDEWDRDPRGNPFVNDVFAVNRQGASATHLWAPRAHLALSTTVYASRFWRHWWRQSSNSAQRPNDAADPACGGMDNLSLTCGNEGRLRLFHAWGVEPRLHTTYRVLGASAESDVGIRLHDERQNRLQKNGDTPTARDGRLVEDNRRFNTALSGFAQQRLRFGDWSVTPGVRVERVWYERRNRLNGASGETALTAVIPGIGVSHQPVAAVVWFAGLHRGFAPPRTEDVINNATGGVVDLDPELSWNFELGTRADLARGLSLDATFFRMDYENQVVPASVAGGVGATLTNAGETLHQGLEAAVRLDTAPMLGSSRNLYLRSAVTWLPVARYAGVRMSAVPGFQSVSIRGNRLPYAPELLATIGVGYAMTSRVDLFVEGVRVGAQFGDDLNTVAGTPDGQRGRIPGHLTWNASANYRLPAMDATLFVTVKNVADTLYIADRSRGLLPGTPRLVQTGLKLRF